MKYFLIISILFGALVAKDRPTVGLVLSGGGARGGAHVGVLKFLEEKRIPIDYIVGTSMGSFMGGMYASGYSANELENFLTTTPWERYITSKKPRKEIPFRRKTLAAEFPGTIKVGVNGENEIALPTGLFEKQMMLELLERKFEHVLGYKNFTKFPIPYAAVATDLLSGEAVELVYGNVAKSVYASICVPGGFEPITINGRVLVDGGISQNLPVEIMRRLYNPDYIIVVDISTPFNKEKKFNSYDEVMSQQLDILTRKNVEDTIKNLRPNEILLEPKLQGYSFLDADKYKEIIAIGYESAKEEYKRFAFLSIDKKSYEIYKQKHRFKPVSIFPVIDKIEIENNTFVSDDTIRYYIHQPIGKRLDFDLLQKDLMRIYYMSYFSSVDYKIVRKNSQNVLVVMTEPSWNAHGDIRAGIEFEDDFNGHSDYQVRMEYNRYGLNAYGGEWRNRVEIGRKRLILSEMYQPLDYTQLSYIRANVYYDKTKYYVTPSFLTQNSVQNSDKTLPIYSKDYGARLGFGLNIGASLQLEAGAEIKKVQPSADLFIQNGGSISYETIKEEQKLSQVYAQLRIDSLDNPFFPKEGSKALLRYYENVKMLNSNLTYSQLYGEASKTFTLHATTFTPLIKVGTTYDEESLKNSQDISAYYHLGGLFNISGRPTYYVTGDRVLFGSLNIRHSVTSNKFLSSITSEAYVGCSLEAGKAWYGKIQNGKANKMLFGSSLYLAIDTIIGPFYLAYGFSDSNHQTLYFSLGKSY